MRSVVFHRVSSSLFVAITFIIIVALIVLVI